MSFSDIVDQYSISEISFLKIDAEGCDYDILMDWAELDIKTDSITFEAAPYMDDNQVNTLLDIFHSMDYVCEKKGRDMYCNKKGSDTVPKTFNYKNKNSWIPKIKEGLSHDE